MESREKGKGFGYAGGQLSTGAVFGQGVTDRYYMNRRGSKTPKPAADFSEELTQATLQARQAADVPGHWAPPAAERLRGAQHAHGARHQGSRRAHGCVWSHSARTCWPPSLAAQIGSG